MNAMSADTELCTVDDINMQKTYIVVTVYHKKRGGKGVWIAVDPGEMIRVTKHIGKRLRVEVESSIPFSQKNLTVALSDLTRPGVEPNYVVEKITLEENDVGGTNAFLQMKLYHLSKKLTFSAEVKTASNVSYKQISTRFGSHNSGRNRLGKVEPVEIGIPKLLVPFKELQVSRSNDFPLHQLNTAPNPIFKRPRRSDIVENISRETKRTRQEAEDFPDLRMNYNASTFLTALEFCLEHYTDWFSWEKDLKNYELFVVVGETLRSRFPLLIQFEGNCYSVMYEYLLPVLLHNIQLEIEVPQTVMKYITPLKNIKYSSNTIREITLSKIDNIEKKYMMQSKYQNELNTQRQFHTFGQDPKPLEYLEEMKSYLNSVIMPLRHGNSIAVGLLIETPIPENIKLIVYRNDQFSSKQEVIPNSFNYVFLEVLPDVNDLFTITLATTGAHLPQLEGLVSLYDLRKDIPSQVIIMLNLVPVRGMDNLKIIGKFRVNQQSAHWESNTNFLPQS